MDKITKTLITVDSVQYLPPSFGKCNRLHGHTFQVKNLVVTTSKCVDFSKIKKLVNQLDHIILAPEKHKVFWEDIQMRRDAMLDPTLPQFVCVYIPAEEVTIEALAKHLEQQILAIDGVENVSFQLFETPTQGAIIEGGE